MHEYLVNEFTLPSCIMPGNAPAGTPGSSRDRNDDGTLKRPMTFETFDKNILAIGPCKRYHLNIEFTRGGPDRRSVYTGGFTPGTEAYATAIKSYFAALAQHIDTLGLDRKKILIAPYDEPGGNVEWSALTADFITLARQGAPEFVYFENPRLRYRRYGDR